MRDRRASIPAMTEGYLTVLGLGALILAIAVLSSQHSRDSRRLKVIERRLALIMNQLDITEFTPGPAPRSLDGTVPPSADVVRELILSNKFRAIKIYREQTGTGLKEAKDAVEAIARQRGL